MFFFKQKTAYELRISDWSSDVCSSDLRHLSRISGPDQFSPGAVAFIASACTLSDNTSASALFTMRWRLTRLWPTKASATISTVKCLSPDPSSPICPLCLALSLITARCTGDRADCSLCSISEATGPFGNWVIVPIYPFRFIFNRVLSRMGLFWLAIHPKHDKGTAASMDAWKGGRRLVPLPVAKNTGNSGHRRKVYGVRPIGQAHGAGSALTMCVNSTRDIITSPE